MAKLYDQLTQEQEAVLVDAIPLITLYIGAADGKLDIQETSWAHRVTEIRAYQHSDKLGDFYHRVSETFDHRLNEHIRHLPEDGEAREQYFQERLSALNPVLDAIPQDHAYHLYRDFLSFASHVAKSSGGFLFMGNVSPEEKRLLELDMIHPVSTDNQI